MDIVARLGETVAFVEVKARDGRAAALEAVTPRQRRRIELGAQSFLAVHPELAALDLRFDVMTVAPGRLPDHLADAWRPED